MKEDNFKGINNVSPHDKMKQGEFRTAVNVDIDNKGRVLRRSGVRKVASGANIHSVWGNDYKTLYAEGNILKLLRNDFSISVLGTLGDNATKLAYSDEDSGVYITDGETNWVVLENNELMRLAPPDPVGAPAAVYVAQGNIPAGEYRVRYTKTDMHGRESAASPPEKVTLPAQGGVSVTFPAGDTSMWDYATVYMTDTGGGTYFAQSEVTVSAGSSSINITFGRVVRRQRLDTQGLSAMAGGSSIFRHAGRTWVVNGGILRYSEGFWPGMTKEHNNYFVFPEDIRVAVPVTNGIFIATDKTYFLSGNSPDEMFLREISEHKAVPGTVVQTKGEKVGAEGFSGVAYLWLTDAGIVVAGNDGLYHNLTEGRYIPPAASEGSGGAVSTEGNDKAVTVARRKETPSGSMAVGDLAEAQIIRNGVVVN